MSLLLLSIALTLMTAGLLSGQNFAPSYTVSAPCRVIAVLMISFTKLVLSACFRTLCKYSYTYILVFSKNSFFGGPVLYVGNKVPFNTPGPDFSFFSKNVNDIGIPGKKIFSASFKLFQIFILYISLLEHYIFYRNFGKCRRI